MPAPSATNPSGPQRLSLPSLARCGEPAPAVGRAERRRAELCAVVLVLRDRAGRVPQHGQCTLSPIEQKAPRDPSGSPLTAAHRGAPGHEPAPLVSALPNRAKASRQAMNGRNAPAPGDLRLVGSQGRGQLHLGPSRAPESCGVMLPSHFWGCPSSLGALRGRQPCPHICRQHCARQSCSAAGKRHKSCYTLAKPPWACFL